MWKKEEFVIFDDKSRLDVDVIYRFIAEESYWGRGRSREAMVEAIEKSVLCFGLYRDAPQGAKQVGFARVVGDNAVCGYIADVFMLGEYRGRGLGKWLIRTVVEHPDVAKLRRVMLHTSTPDFYRDARFEIYDQSGASKFMERPLRGTAKR